MRLFVGTSVVAAILLHGTAAQARDTPIRRVELIAMARPSSEPAASDDPATSVMLDSFRVHDLSRRYVEYRMAQEIAEAPVTPAQPVQMSAGVAPVSGIAVPMWMRAAGSVVPFHTIAGCDAQPYRPSGILSAAAELRRAAHYGMVSAIACEEGLPVALFDAMIIRESRYDPSATSPKAAYGLAQLMPVTAASLGVDRFDPAQNLRGGARYLRRQLDRFGHVHLALAAYNAGPGRVRGGRVPRIAETQAYVANILTNWTRLGGVRRPTSNPFQQPTNVGRQVQLASF